MSNISVISVVSLGEFNYNDKDGSTITFYGWGATVNVDGQVGVTTVWVDTNDPDSVKEAIIQDLLTNPQDFQGIVDNDPNDSQDPDQGWDQDGWEYAGGDYGDEDTGFEDDGGGGEVAGGDGGDFVGESV